MQITLILIVCICLTVITVTSLSKLLMTGWAQEAQEDYPEQSNQLMEEVHFLGIVRLVSAIIAGICLLSAVLL